MFVSHGLLLTGVGVMCGLLAAIVSMRLLSSLLFNVKPVDPVTYGAASLGLVATAWLASYLPSRVRRPWIPWRPCGQSSSPLIACSPAKQTGK